MMRIAIASSGLGHVSRGIETWALDTARALAQRDVDVTLFSGAPIDQAGAQDSSVNTVTLPCLRRSSAAARRLSAVMPRWAWRWGLRSPYGWEQFMFWRRLWPRLREGRFDILHVQDPMLAYWCRLCRRLRLVSTKEILAHGTEEPAEFLARFDHVQHLAPWHLQDVEDSGRRRRAECDLDLPGSPSLPQGGTRSGFAGSSPAGAGRGAEQAGHDGRHWAAIPNFVDIDDFRPAAGWGDRASCRKKFGLPATALIVGAVAAVKRHHKRIDYLIKEYATFHRRWQDSVLVIAGARQDDSDELVSLARDMAGDSVHILLDVPRKDMPELYRAMDVFVLTSLFEMMPIALVEALASGLPVVVNDHPVLRWMTGTGESQIADLNVEHDDGVSESAGSDHSAGGGCIDMSADGVLSTFLCNVMPDWLASSGKNARLRAERMFAADVVIDQLIKYYESILELERSRKASR